MQIRTILIITLLSCSLTSCLNYDFSRRVVQQGNLLPQAKVERLKNGMSKEDVAILMGTSLVGPMFEMDRWDYAFTLRVGSGKVVPRTLVLYFNRGVLTRIEHPHTLAS